jgi:hypothetical protein
VVPAGTASDVVTTHFDLLPGNRTAAGIRLFRNVKSCLTLNTNQNKTAIVILIANKEICKYIKELCKNNNYNPIITANLEELIKKIRGMSSAIVFVDHEVVNHYGARIYSRINVACSICDVLLLCD